MRGVVGLFCLAACRINFDAVATGDAMTTGDGGDAGDAGDGAVVAGAERTLSATGDCGAVAWSGDRAGVAWREGTNPGTVRFATVDQTATILDGPISIGSSLANLDCPVIAWTGSKFLVTMAYGASVRDIDSTTVSGTTPTAFVNVVTDSADSRAPALAYQGADVAFTWQSIRGTNYDVDIKRAAPDGTSTYTAFVASSSMSDAPTITYDGANFTAFWVAGTQIHAYELALSGSSPGEQTLTALGAASGRIGAAFNGTDVDLAWTDSTTNTKLSVARVSSAGALIAGPTSLAAAQAQNLAATWTGSRFGVVYLETSSLVQAHLAQFAADTTFLDDTPLANATTTTIPSVAWTGDHYVAAFQSNVGLIVKFVVPP